MRVLFTSIRNIGHFQPLVPLIEACVAGGCDVHVGTPPDLEERVRRTGATFVPLGHPGDTGLGPLWQEMRDVPPPERNRFVMGRIFAGACAKAALPALLEHAERSPPDVIVREAQEYAGLLVGEKLSIPTVRVAISLERLLRDCFPTLLPVLDEHRASLGLPSDPEGQALHEPIFTQFPAALWQEAPHEDVRRFRVSDASVRGPLPLERPAAWNDDSLPLVYLTLGTVAGSMSELRDAYRLVLDAVATLPVRALLTTGDALDPASLGVVPERVHVERFVPQAELLPYVSAIVCHGGSGTVLGALAAGVPLVVVPMFADQPANAEQVEAAGAGIAVPLERATAATVATALTRLLDEPAFTARARTIASSIADLPHARETPGWLREIARHEGPRARR